MGAIIVAVGAVVQDSQARVLLVRHRPERGGFWKGKWICPGGKLRLGESIADGICREVAEETGLQIELTRPLPAFERIHKEGRKTVLHVIYVDFMARRLSGALRAGSDVGEAIWQTKEEIAMLGDELHEDTRKLLRLAGLV